MQFDIPGCRVRFVADWLGVIICNNLPDLPIVITVTAAIIQHDNTILAARRKKGLHLAGYWEFPGGKVEPGETEEECLLRELVEELGIKAKLTGFFGESIYDYGDRVIRLRAYLATTDRCKLQSLDHDLLLWVPIDRLDTLTWAPADWPLVHQLLQFP